MARKRLTPAQVVAKELGIRPLARRLELSPSTVKRWQSRDGLVPSRYHIAILMAAKGKVTSDELVHGRAPT